MCCYRKLDYGNRIGSTAACEDGRRGELSNDAYLNDVKKGKPPRRLSIVGRREARRRRVVGGGGVYYYIVIV